MVWFHRDPFWTDWTRVQHDADRLFSTLLPEVRATGPRVRLFRDGDELQLTAEVPGLAPAELDLQVEGHVLTLTGYAPEEGEEPRAVRFRRSFRMPFRLDAETIQARLELGLLAVRAQRLAADRPKSIPVLARADRTQE
jgi:HSP20 family protein